MQTAIPDEWRELHARRRDVLLTLYRRGPIRTSALYADETKASAHRALNGLADAGLIERYESDDDGRVTMNALTWDGQDLVRRVVDPDA